jgi:hypothetical protein
MITFYQLGMLGRLGNQLFQYAALKSLGLENGYEVKIPNPGDRQWHGQQCLLDKFNIKSPYLKETDISKLKHSYSEPDYMKYDNNFYNIPDNTNLTGFFQSTLYFKKHAEEIKRELQPAAHFAEEAQKHIHYLKDKNPGYEIVSLHLRRGDNTDSTDPKQVELNNSYGEPGTSVFSSESLYYQYFIDAKKVFENKKVKFLVFTGGKRGTDNNRDDVEWCKQNFQGTDFLFSENKSTMKDFSLIMSCDHNIISHVSSFGWWAAYLNNNDKTVVAPLKYHPDRLDIDYRAGFYPDAWRLV